MENKLIAKPIAETTGREEEELITILHMSYGEVSALFMSQGNTKAKNIVMPEKEIFDISLKVERAIKSFLKK